MEDNKIIDLFFARNEDAIVETDAAYGRRLFALANNVLQNREDAQECVSDTYLKTWDTIPPLRPQFFFGYLAKLCRHFSLGKLDWKNAAKRKAEVVALTQEMENCIPAKCQDTQLDRMELRRVLEAFLEDLSKENRLIFLRRYLYVDTVAEIAARYGISESKVKTQLHRTRAKLHTYLAKEGIHV